MRNAIAGCTFALALSVVPRAHAQVALVSRVPADQAVLVQLAGMIDEPLSERVEPEVRGLGAIMDDARGSWGVRYVVVIDRAGDSVHALRPSDRTSASRVLTPELLAESPYAVALAIAELLEWLGVTPRGAAAPAPAPAPSALPDDNEPPQEPVAAEAEAPLRFGVAIAAGFELSGSPSADLSLARLALGLEAQLGRAQRSLWLALAARFSAPAGLERRLEPALRSIGADMLEYESSELALQLAFGLGKGASTLALGPFVGLSPVRAKILDAAGDNAGDHEVTTGFAGLGVRVRYPLAWGFAFDLSAEAELLFEPVRYQVAGRYVLDDGPVRAQTRLCLVWESVLFR